MANYGYPIPLRNLPGVGPLEWALAQSGWTQGTEERAADVAQKLFGIADEETYCWVDENGTAWLAGVEFTPSSDEGRYAALAAWESHFDVLRLFRDESDAYWASVGWGVTDESGKQLEAMRALGRPLVCFVKRIHAEALPRLGGVGDSQDAESWGARLAEEAKRFRR